MDVRVLHVNGAPKKTVLLLNKSRRSLSDECQMRFWENADFWEFFWSLNHAPIFMYQLTEQRIHLGSNDGCTSVCEGANEYFVTRCNQNLYINHS